MTPISLFDMYLEYGENLIVTRSNLLNDILNYVNDLVILTAHGYATLVLFRDNAVATQKMTKYDDDEDDLEMASNDTACKRWSCHSGHKLLCKLCRT